MSIRVLVADDSKAVREAITRLFKNDPEINLVGEAISLTETIQLIGELHPNVLVMDLHMHDEKTVLPLHFKSCLNGTRLLPISLWNDDETKALAGTFGAMILLDKMNLSAELIPTIRNCVS